MHARAKKEASDSGMDWVGTAAVQVVATLFSLFIAGAVAGLPDIRSRGAQTELASQTEAITRLETSQKEGMARLETSQKEGMGALEKKFDGLEKNADGLTFVAICLALAATYVLGKEQSGQATKRR